MNNWKLYLFGSFSFLSLILSIVTFCSFENYDYDKISMLMSGFSVFVAALGVIVTLLITWQIYNTMSIEKVRKETIQTAKDVIAKSNTNQLISLQGLAGFYTVQYNKLEETEDLTVIESLFFAAMLHWAMTIDLCCQLNQVGLFTSSVTSANLLVDDNLFEENDRQQIINILSNVPDSWRTTDFQRLYNTLLKQNAPEEDE